jgi:DNA segregation ATPase FtsK/SpoIIIE, S-DNA-T family
VSTLVTRRPARFRPPEPGSTALELAAPPRQGESLPITGSMGMILVPAASGVGAVLLAVTHQDRPLLAAAGLLVLAASIAVGLLMVIGSRTGDRRRTREQR